MKISLRKAASIQVAVHEVLSGLSMSPVVEVSIFETDRKTALADAADIFGKTISKRAHLYDALYKIRASVGERNQSGGVNEILGRQARITKDIELMSPLTVLVPTESDEIINGRVQRLLRRDDAAPATYGRQSASHETIEICVLGQEAIEDYALKLKALKLQKQNLKDELAELNVKLAIDLDEVTAALLRQEAII